MEARQKRILKTTIMGRTYETSQLRVAAVLLVPMLALTVMFFVVPVVQVVYYSFTNFNLTKNVKDWIGLGNFKYIFTDRKFYKALRNTFCFTLAKLLFDTTLALAIALVLDSRIPMRKYLRASYFAPVVVPVVASALIWIWFFDPSLGPFNQILEFLGLPKSEWIYREDTALMSIVMFSIWKGVGYNIMLFLAGLQNIPDYYIDAASVDGASPFQILVKIKLPLLRPIVSFVVMMGLINTFKVFTEVNVMTPKGGPLYSTALIVNYIYEQAFTSGKMGRGCAAALVLFAIIFALTLIQSRTGASKTLDLE